MGTLLIEIAKMLLLSFLMILTGVDIAITYRKLKCEKELIKKLDENLISTEDAIREAYDIIDD